jgi:hypothetical protein
MHDDPKQRSEEREAAPLKAESTAQGSGQQVEAHTGYAVFAPAGRASLGQMVDQVHDIIRYALEQQMGRLLIDLTHLTGFENPSLPDRYWIVRKWASTAGSRVDLALVLEARYIDPDRFGVKVAVNFGMRADVFTSRSDALTWLLSGEPSSVHKGTDRIS